MAGGSLDHTGAIVLVAFALILGCFFACRLIRAPRWNRHRLPHLSVYGDFPAVPRELVTGPKKAGGGEPNSRPATVTRRNKGHGSHVHDGTGL
jgi:hypothetical protein